MLLRTVFLLLGIAAVLHALRVKDSIRVQLTSVDNNCMRLLNATHQIGCQSNLEGNTGVVTPIKTAEDIKRHLELLPWGLSQLIALVNVKNLDRELLKELKDHEQIVGILLYRNRTDRQFVGFSEDGSCPNREHSFYPRSAQCDWNSRSALFPDGSFFAEYNKPIFIVENSTEISLLLDACYQVFNKPSESLLSNNYRCMARMKSFMLAAGDAHLCQTRQTHEILTAEGLPLCDKLSDFNLISMLPPVDSTQKRANVFVLATRMDSFSMFSGSRGGDVSVLGSLITMLSVARSIGRNRLEVEKASKETGRQIMFALFNLESFGNVGSSRFVYELHEPAPVHHPTPGRWAKWIKAEDLGAFVELQHLSANHTTFYLHGDGQVAKEFEQAIDSMQKSAEKGASKATIECQVEPLYRQPNARLPPASYQTILKARRIPGFVLTPFRDHYETNTINSFFDTQIGEMNSTSAKQQVLWDIESSTNIVMRIALDYVSGGDEQLAEKFEFDREFASTLVDCFLFDPKWECPFFEDLLKNQSIRIIPHVTYPGFGVSSTRELAHAILVNVLGDHNSATNIRHQSECLAKNKNQDLYVYHWQNDPSTDNFYCYKTSIYQRLAESPSSLSGHTLYNNTYSSWAESRWERIELEVFLDAGYKLELQAFGLALIVVAISALIFWLLNENWFNNPNDVLPADV